MAVDLHTHSTASDGSVDPARLVGMAVERGLTALALTDHDTLEGVAEAAEAADTVDLELISGTELSLAYDRGGMHLVVLWLEPGPGPLQDKLLALQHGRGDRNTRIVEILNDHGMALTMDEVAVEAGGGSVGRPHIAAVMVDKGYVPDIRTAFDDWLANDQPAYVNRPKLNPEEAIRLARQSGAVPVLAHPHTLGVHRSHEMAALLNRLRSAGLVGLEAIYATYRRHEREGYADLARRFGLVPSGGSDFHGTYKPGLELGIGYGDLVVRESTLEELRAHAHT
ncbi:MAG: PHP domain-containing protein [Actinomycetota bacterium]|nr:PHP domain-containing protein [Actinomycetota bacterium]